MLSTEQLRTERDSARASISTLEQQQKELQIKQDSVQARILSLQQQFKQLKQREKAWDEAQEKHSRVCHRLHAAAEASKRTEKTTRAALAMRNKEIAGLKVWLLRLGLLTYAQT